MARQRVWMKVKPLTPQEKVEIAARCERLIAETLKPRFLPEIRPTPFNYPVEIFGKWRGRRYSFVTRYRSGFAENAGQEFDAPFAALEHLEERYEAARFDLMGMRHTGRWWLLHRALSLEEALKLIAADEMLEPC
jgi:hypothetical protein